VALRIQPNTPIHAPIPPSRLTPCHLPLHKGGFAGRTLFAPTMHFFDSLGSPSRGAPPLGGEGWPGGQKSTTNHPSVTCGDSSPRRGATLCTLYFGCHRGEHCSPAESCAAAKLPGRTLFAPTTYPKSAIKNRNFASSHRRVLAPGSHSRRTEQQTLIVIPPQI